MRVKLINVDNRLKIKFDKTDGIYNWGDDNAYPSLVKSLIGSSVTARQCVDMNAKYIYGKGFKFVDSVLDKSLLVVNKKEHSLNQLLRIVSKEFAEQNNIFLHVNYNSLFEVTSVDLLPCTDVRIGKSDSTGYSGKFVKYNNFDKSKDKNVKSEDFAIIDRLNMNSSVIQAQVDAAGGWSKYKGQILHVTSDFSELYSLTDADSVLLDCDSEHQASLYKNSGLRKGFFGAKLFITKKFSDDDERDDFVKTIEDLKGAEDSNGILHLEADLETDVLSEQMLIQNIDSNIDDKTFESTESSTSRNIRKAFGVPAILLEDSDNSIFGNSGELLIQAKMMHWENKEEERNIITEAFEKVFSRFHVNLNPNNDWTVKPIIDVKADNINE